MTASDEPPPWDVNDDEQDEDDTCPFCGRDATEEYEGQAYCGGFQCGYTMQAGLDYIRERGG